MELKKYENISLLDANYETINVEAVAIKGIVVEDLQINNSLEIYRSEVSNASVTGIDVSTVILRDLTINHSAIEHLENDDIFLQNIVIENSELKNSDLSNAVLDNVTFKNSVLHSVDLINTHFNNVTFENCTFINMNFEKINEAAQTVMIEPKFFNTKLDLNSGIQVINNQQLINPAMTSLSVDSYNFTESLLKRNEDLLPREFIQIPNQKEYVFIHDKEREQLFQLTFKDNKLVNLEPHNEAFLTELKETQFTALFQAHKYEIVSYENEFSEKLHELNSVSNSIKPLQRNLQYEFYDLMYGFENVDSIKYQLNDLYELKESIKDIQSLHDDYFDKFSPVAEDLKKTIFMHPEHPNIDKVNSMYYTMLAQNKLMQQTSQQLQARSNYVSTFINETVNSLTVNQSAIKNAQYLLPVVSAENIVKLNLNKNPLNHEMTDKLNQNLTPQAFNNQLVNGEVRTLEEQKNQLLVNLSIVNEANTEAFGNHNLWGLPKITSELSLKMHQKLNELNAVLEAEKVLHTPERQKEMNNTNEMEISR